MVVREIANSPMTEIEVQIQYLNDQIDKALVIRNIAQSLHDKVFGAFPPSASGEDEGKPCRDYSNGILGTLQLKLDQLNQLQSESMELLTKLTKGI